MSWFTQIQNTRSLNNNMAFIDEYFSQLQVRSMRSGWCFDII